MGVPLYKSSILDWDFSLDTIHFGVLSFMETPIFLGLATFFAAHQPKVSCMAHLQADASQYSWGEHKPMFPFAFGGKILLNDRSNMIEVAIRL